MTDETAGATEQGGWFEVEAIGTGKVDLTFTPDQTDGFAIHVPWLDSLRLGVALVIESQEAARRAGVPPQDFHTAHLAATEAAIESAGLT